MRVLLWFLLPLSDTMPLLLFQRAGVSGQPFQCKQVSRILCSRLQHDGTEEVGDICRQVAGQCVVGPVAVPVGRDKTVGQKQFKVAGDVGL